MGYGQGFSRHLNQLWHHKVCSILQKLPCLGWNKLYFSLPFYWRNYLLRGRHFLLDSDSLLIEVLPPPLPAKRTLYNPFAVIRRWLGAPEQPALIIDVTAVRLPMSSPKDC
ncbi:hypothetical protein [Almyronema epifaneia]|uniref:Transposase DDE domain-containing protein n=1 Tax=Almyronema epifaneia S1 TaxID=2991925 RepID=A0ABW6I9T4_9CYAN